MTTAIAAYRKPKTAAEVAKAIAVFLKDEFNFETWDAGQGGRLALGVDLGDDVDDRLEILIGDGWAEAEFLGAEERALVDAYRRKAGTFYPSIVAGLKTPDTPAELMEWIRLVVDICTPMVASQTSGGDGLEVTLLHGEEVEIAATDPHAKLKAVAVEAGPEGMVSAWLTVDERNAIEEARALGLKGQALIEKMRVPTNAQDFARAVFELLDDHWSIDGGWALNKFGGRTTIKTPNDGYFNVLVSDERRDDGGDVVELDEQRLGMLSAWERAGRPAVDFAASAPKKPSEFEETFRFINFPEGMLGRDVGVRVAITSDEAAGDPYGNKQGRSSMRLDDGRVMTVTLVQAGDSLHEDPRFADAYGRENVEPDGWIEVIRALRNRLLEWLESSDEVSEVEFRAGGNGYGTFRVILDDASVLLGIGRNPDV